MEAIIRYLLDFLVAAVWYVLWLPLSLWNWSTGFFGRLVISFQLAWNWIRATLRWALDLVERAKPALAAAWKDVWVGTWLRAFTWLRKVSSLLQPAMEASAILTFLVLRLPLALALQATRGTAILVLYSYTWLKAAASPGATFASAIDGVIFEVERRVARAFGDARKWINTLGAWLGHTMRKEGIITREVLYYSSRVWVGDLVTMLLSELVLEDPAPRAAELGLQLPPRGIEQVLVDLSSGAIAASPAMQAALARFAARTAGQASAGS